MFDSIPPPFDFVVDTFKIIVDARQSDSIGPLVVGQLLAGGRRTATSWFLAGGIADQYKRAYTVLGSIGRNLAQRLAAVLFSRIIATMDTGEKFLFVADDTPTQRYGPEVEGAGIHRNPTQGPAHHKYLYGHIWVTLGLGVRHPECGYICLPFLADMYIREIDLAHIPSDHRPEFATKLELAAQQLSWIRMRLTYQRKPIWIVYDGFYAKRPVLKAAKESNITMVSRLRKDAALRTVPEEIPPGKRKRGKPRKYGKQPISLKKRAAHPQGWQEIECFQYQKVVVKKVKTFLATWRPAGGLIRVVIVREADGTWIPFFCTDVEASAKDILEAAAGRTSTEQMYKEVKEVEGAGQQQLRNRHANIGAFHWCLWGFTMVEWWAWNKPAEELNDRSGKPWDQEPRRVSHAEKRKALQRVILEKEFQRRWGDGPMTAEIREIVEVLMNMAT